MGELSLHPFDQDGAGAVGQTLIPYVARSQPLGIGSGSAAAVLPRSHLDARLGAVLEKQFPRFSLSFLRSSRVLSWVRRGRPHETVPVDQPSAAPSTIPGIHPLYGVRISHRQIRPGHGSRVADASILLAFWRRVVLPGSRLNG